MELIVQEVNREVRVFETKKGVKGELTITIEPPSGLYSPCGGTSYRDFVPAFTHPGDFMKHGYVGVRSYTAEEYFSEFKLEKDWLTRRGIGPEDRISVIKWFFPLPSGWPRQMGVGGVVMNEVTADCERSGSAVVLCDTRRTEMLGLLRNSKFGFEEAPEKVHGVFIRVFPENMSRNASRVRDSSEIVLEKRG